MKKKMGLSTILFLVGFFGAILIGALQYFDVLGEKAWIPIFLIVAGIVIGVMNVKIKERVPVALATLLLGASAGVLSQIPSVGAFFEAILTKIAFLSVPIGIVVAFMILYERLK